MGRKRSKPRSPRQNDRKAKRTAKGAILQYYDENLTDTSTQEHSPPARDHVSVSVAVEQGEISTISPPVPEQNHDHAAVEKGDFSTKSPAPEPVPVSSAVEKGDIPIKSPPGPGVDCDDATDDQVTEQDSVSTTVEKAEKTVRSVVSDPSRRSEVPGIANNMSTPNIENMLQDSRSTNLLPSKEMSKFENLLTPGSQQPIRHFSTATPLGVGRQRSLSLNLNLSLKEELELATSTDTSSNVVENTSEKTVRSDLPESGVEIDTDHVDNKEQLSNDKLEVDHQSWKILSNVYDLLHYRDNAHVELEETINQHVNTINTLTHEKNKQDMQIDSLSKRLFLQDQEMKVMADEIKQLRDTSTYRKEVKRLEETLERDELEMRAMQEDLNSKVNKIHFLEKECKASLAEKLEIEEVLKQNNIKIKEKDEELRSNLDKVKILEDNKIFLMNENTILKNEAKLKVNHEPRSSHLGKQMDTVDTHTHADGPIFSNTGVSFGVDFGVDACVQTDEQFSKCTKCELDKILIKELIESLETMERSISYTQALEVLALEDRIVNDITLENLRNMSTTVHPSGTSYIPSVQDTSLAQMNRFHALQHSNSSTYTTQSSTTTQPPTECPLPLVPGPKLYSETVRDSEITMIITDSMTGGVKANRIKKNIGRKDEQIFIKRFPGHTAEDIAFYASKPLSEKKPDRVIIVAGTNDLSKAVYEKDSIDEYEVVGSLMNIARTAREQGAKTVHVSSIITRRGHRYSELIKKVNDLLYMACIAEDFVFMDQADITMAHVSTDGIHLNSHGTSILLYNIMSVFNSFDGDSIDFKHDYDYAMSLC